jgi:hypothetical protein
VILSVLLVPGMATLRAESAPADSILFLKFRLVDGRLTAAGVTVVPGTCKQPRIVTPVQDHFYFSVQNGKGAMLFEGVIPDPARTRYEYVDEEGRLQSTMLVSDSVDFYVRIPYRADARRAEFSRITGVAMHAGGPAKTLLPLGAVDIALEERTDE